MTYANVKTVPLPRPGGEDADRNEARYRAEVKRALDRVDIALSELVRINAAQQAQIDDLLSRVATLEGA